jgi:hypothetical protein
MPNQSAYDIRLTTSDVDLALMLARPSSDGIAGRMGARRPPAPRTLTLGVRRGEGPQAQEERTTYKDTSGGAGWGERLADNVYSYGAPSHNRVPGMILPPGQLEQVSGFPSIAGSVRAGFELGADLYVVAGSFAVKLPNGNGTPVVDQNLATGGDFTAYSALTWDGNGYVGGEMTGAGIWRCDGTSRAWTRSADVRRKYLASVYWVRGNVGKQRLVGSSWAGGVLYSWATSSILYTDSDDPMTEAVWSEEIAVGNAEYSITGLGASNQVLYVLKTNGLHTLDDRLYSPNVTAYRQNQHELNNPSKPVLVFNGHAYFGSEHRGLERVPIAGGSSLARADRPQQCNFGFGLPNTSPIGGEATALCNDNGWLAQTYYSATSDTTYLCYGLDYADLNLSAPGVGGPLLHHGAEAVIPGVRIDWLFWHAPAGANFAPALLLGGINTSTSLAVLYRLSLPRFGNPYQDLLLGGPMQFADTWVCDFPRDNWGNDGWTKDTTRVTIRGDRLGDAALRVYGAQDGGAFGSELGVSTSEYDYFPLDTQTAARDWTFRVQGSGTSTAPAILRSFEAQASVYIETAPVVTYTVVAGTGTVNHVGKEDTRDPYLVEAALRVLAGQRCTLRDERGRTRVGRVLQQGLEVAWEELPSGERTGRITATVPVMLLDDQLRLDTGWPLDALRRLAG